MRISSSLFLAILCCSSLRPCKAQTYTVFDLGTLGGPTSEAIGINNLGQVVGKAQDAQSHSLATLFSGDNSPNLNLGGLGGTESKAVAINESGQIVGDALQADGSSRATLYSYSGHEVGLAGNVDLGTLGGKSSSASAINDRGDIVGTADIATTPYFYAASFSVDQAPKNLGGLGGYYSSASAINSQGQIAGFSSVPGDAQHAAFYDTDGKISDICNLPNNSYARDINSAGQMVGYRMDSEHPRGNRFSLGGAPLDLGTLGGKESYAYAINNDGIIVGSATLPGGYTYHGFIYREGVMIDLNSLIPKTANVEIVAANDINERQQIAAVGILNGRKRALRLDLAVAPPPTPPPPPLPPVPPVKYYKILVKASPAGKGSVKGGASYVTGSKVSVVAKARPGYAFLYWTDGKKIASRTANYRFTAAHARTLVAHFR